MVDNLSLADGKLEALTSHVFDEHGKVQLTAAGNLEAVSGIRLLHAKAHVGVKLAEQAVTDVTGGDVFSLLAC